MNEPGERTVTELLGALRAGDRGALEVLVRQVYDELRRIARRQLARERPSHTLSATALVHEAYLKLIAQDRATFQDRAHFLSVAALAMRRILVTYARSRMAAKRGGGLVPVSLHDSALSDGLAAQELVLVDEALSRLQEMHERQGQVVAYRFYGGLTDQEIAHVLGVSLPTVRRDWRVARAWLMREIGRTS